MSAKKFYLASRSPRRAELLEQIGVRFQLLDCEVDESVLPDEAPLEFVQRLAANKASAALELLRQRGRADGAVVLGADTIVFTEQQVMGKPHDNVMAANYLAQLSGRTHRVATAVAVGSLDRGRPVLCDALSVSEVQFKSLRQEEIDAYCATGEPCDKAGGYAVQGLAAVFIKSISGSYSGIMGLPLFETAALLAGAGVPTGLQGNEKQ